MGSAGSSLGRDFAEAIAAKDHDGLLSLLHPEVDFRGLTPNRAWEVSGAPEVVSVAFESWFEEGDQIDELIAVDVGSFADRERVAYSLRGRNGDGPFVVEQQAYFAAADGRITWMRVLCSGFRPAPGTAADPA